MRLFAYPYEMTATLLVRGEDAADFLQSQFSNDLRPFSAGQCTYGLWLDVKGKILADSWVLCDSEESFWIFSEHCEGRGIMDKLEQHIIADDVELDSAPQAGGLVLMGEPGGEGFPGADAQLCSFSGRRSRMPSRELVFPDPGSRSAWMDGQDFEIVSGEWMQNERMKAGVPVVGVEALPGDLPAEAGLVEDAVSLTKGCFLGQEVVARMHNIGRPQRKLFTLSGSGDAPEPPGPVANEAGKSLGELRTSLRAPEAGAAGWQGVAMLKSRFVACGESVALGERPATVENAYTGMS